MHRTWRSKYPCCYAHIVMVALYNLERILRWENGIVGHYRNLHLRKLTNSECTWLCTSTRGSTMLCNLLCFTINSWMMTYLLSLHLASIYILNAWSWWFLIMLFCRGIQPVWYVITTCFSCIKDCCYIRLNHVPSTVSFNVSCSWAECIVVETPKDH